MAQKRAGDPKADTLREQGVLNGHAGQVSDKLFAEHEFFDARDAVQVKYEMVRRVEAEGASVTEASAAFGFSRPSFYQAQEALRLHGLSGLLPRKRGPRAAHKLSEEVVEFLLKARDKDRDGSALELAKRVEERFGIRVHPRSIERALARQKKKRQ
ncbi:MAG TPA: helix-turn-helix domain-containing protein [Polyangiaceae bacterium]|nr:helix-turn-helix domain-containing protein [Polyangiaceae bacterium]